MLKHIHHLWAPLATGMVSDAGRRCKIWVCCNPQIQPFLLGALGEVLTHLTHQDGHRQSGTVLLPTPVRGTQPPHAWPPSMGHAHQGGQCMIRTEQKYLKPSRATLRDLSPSTNSLHTVTATQCEAQHAGILHTAEKSRPERHGML